MILNLGAAVAIVAFQTTPATFSIPAGPTTESLHRLAAQSGVDIAIAVDLSGRRSPALSGRMSIDAALERLLRPAGARAVRLRPGVYRIQAAPRPAPRPAPPPPAEPPPALLEAVVVTAPAQRGGLDGANGRSPIDAGALDRAEGLLTSDAIAGLSATVDSTRQGAGRNKLFIRGLADSAFNGPLQATVGQYLGDLRLTYGSPDPDLALVDMRRIEVFEGPQGSRFGAGSIGGVVRMQPALPMLNAPSILTSTGLSATAQGAPGADVSLVVNQPIGPDAAVRAAAYFRRDGGFIDGPDGARDLDSAKTAGLRVSARILHRDWTLDLTALTQRVEAADSPTTPSDAASPVKTGSVAEPYDSALSLAGVTVSRRFGDVTLTSATGLSRQVLQERFDATVSGQPAVVDRLQTTLALSSETRLQTDPAAAWALSGGVSFAAGETEAQRTRHSLDEITPGALDANLRRSFAEAALFGEVVGTLQPRLKVALGGRLSALRVVTTFRPTGAGAGATRARPDGSELAFTPSLAVRWETPDGPTAFARLEQGVRPGGVSEARAVLQQYEADRVTLAEVGLRTPDTTPDWRGEVSVGYIDWRNVQADTVTTGGDLVTVNAGDGGVAFFQAKGAWSPTESVSLSGGVFFNASRLRLDGFSVIGSAGGAIPNVAPVGAQLSVDYEPGRFLGEALSLGADFRYVGPSRVGFGPGLDVPQGDYVNADLTARLGDERRALSLRISNPFDVWAVRYGLGSPYQLSDPHSAPLRPLTIRLGFEAAF